MGPHRTDDLDPGLKFMSCFKHVDVDLAIQQLLLL